MSICEELEGKTIAGTKKPGTWSVLEKVTCKPGHTGGTFSVGYLVRHSDGTDGFMKASDIGKITASPAADPSTIGLAFSQFGFEQSILEYCVGNRMDRVVTAIDHGSNPVIHKGVQDYLFFLIFERAEGDVRDKLDEGPDLELVWILHALHNLAVATQQLHSSKVAHNDIKPSNLLAFSDSLQKLADLGRAVRGDGSSPYDKLVIPGSKLYAPPELLYHLGPGSGLEIVPINSRRATDLYLLGSMIFCFLTGTMFTPFVLSKLDINIHPTTFTGNFEDVLPHWQSALSDALDIIDLKIKACVELPHKNALSALKLAFTQLCSPDPLKRGHPSSKISEKKRVYSVERYISLFDKHRRRVG